MFFNPYSSHYGNFKRRCLTQTVSGCEETRLFHFPQLFSRRFSPPPPTCSGRKAPNPPEGGPKRTAPNAPGAQQNAAAAVAAAANVLADLMGKVFGGVPDFVKELVELGNNVDPL